MGDIKDIRKGSIIHGPKWPEPVEIDLIEEMGEYVQILGVTINSREHVNQLISKEDFKDINLFVEDVRCSNDAREIFLALETKRYRYASLYDPLLAMNTSKVDPLPHQIEAVYGYILKIPRIRFLIADDPGAGKTIMAGLIIKELKLRNLAKRIMIVAPGHLRDQWRRELKERFEEKFIAIDRSIYDSLYGENVFNRENQIIASIDFAKREDISRSIAGANFDLVIVDEAHKMSAYQYGAKVQKTSRYRLGELLGKKTEHFLFLTATPHKGDPENFRLFLDLLDTGFFATTAMVRQSIQDQDNPLFIRRVKEDLKDFDGKPLFLPRYVVTKGFDLGTRSPKEKELYNELSEYVEKQYNLALRRDKKRNVAFALIILQRRLASSTYALYRSLERRKKRLESILEEADLRTVFREEEPDFETVEDMSEEERWKEEERWETLSMSENREELNKEIQIIKRLIDKAKSIIATDDQAKLIEFRSAIKELSEKYPDPKDQKILIFTESKDTLYYLEKKIKEWGYSVNTIHGGMKLDERVTAEKIFKNETQIMVATEAAGEGINLQFCHLMINYDIPWNPNRLEQRMGRIHRYGQQKEVYIFNLVATDTREGRVLNRLFEKLEEIKAALGADKVFDCISEVLMDKNLAQMMLEAAANARTIDEILEEIDIEVDEEYTSMVKESLGESLATHYIDYTRIKEMAQKAREHRLIPEYTEAFFKKAMEKTGGKLRIRSDGFLAIDTIPYLIRKIADEENFKKTFGSILRKYSKITFDKEIAFKNADAEFVSFGHPLFEAVMRWIEHNFNQRLSGGATFLDPDGLMDGYILYYECEVKDGTGQVAGKRLYSFLMQDGNVHQVSPSVIWDLEESKENLSSQIVDVENLKKSAIGHVLPILEKYKEEILEERERQAEIKKKYGVKSLDYLIVKLDGELIELQERLDKGEDVSLAIYNKKQKLEEYSKSLEQLKSLTRKEVSLTLSNPRFTGILQVLPKPGISSPMHSDPETEKIGMDVAMEHERKEGRIPEDVSKENLGFDIRSTDNEENIRYIEVKARAAIGDVAITKNEWFKARRFQDDYYLYAVMNAKTSPELFIVQNPSEKLNPEEKLEVVRYIISKKQIVQKGL